MPSRFLSCLAIIVLATAPAALADAAWTPLLQPGNLDGWTRADGTPAKPGGWTIAGGVLSLEKPGAGDLVSAREFGDCEIAFEWKVAPGGNSGVKYRLRRTGKDWIGCEYQLLDDARHANGKVPKTSTASLYDVLAPAPDKPAKPAGEWNESRIVARGTALEHWLNGQCVLRADTASPAFAAAVAASKFRATQGFAKPGPGRLLIQDHGDKVALRNLRIRPLGGE